MIPPEDLPGSVGEAAAAAQAEAGEAQPEPPVYYRPKGYEPLAGIPAMDNWTPWDGAPSFPEPLAGIPPMEPEDYEPTVGLPGPSAEPDLNWWQEGSWPAAGIPAERDAPEERPESWETPENSTVPLIRRTEEPEDSFVRVDRYTGPVISCVQGALQGTQFSVNGETVLGVDRSCDIIVPLGTPGVSRRHMRFWAEEGIPYAMDLRSTYGTWLNGEQMKPGLAYRMSSGDRIFIGREEWYEVM